MTGDLPAPYDDIPQASERSRGVALVLATLGGVFGLHRFYVGRPQSGVYMVLTLGGLGIWWLYDMVTVVAGEFRDREGLPVRNWGVPEEATFAGAGPRQIAQLTEQVEQLQLQMGEVAERLDFAERLLTQQRERERLSKGT
jgi:TM2 domain-containing membrane protein YozV